MFSDSRELDHLPVITLATSVSSQQSTHQIIRVPSSPDDHDAAAGCESCVEGTCVPVPNGVSDRCGGCLCTIFEGIIDKEDVSTHACNAPTNARRAINALVTDYFKSVGLSDRTSTTSPELRVRKNSPIPGRVDDALNIPIESVRKVCRVTSRDDRCIRVSPQCVSREEPRSELALPVSWRHCDHQPRGLSAINLLEELVEFIADCLMHPPEGVELILHTSEPCQGLAGGSVVKNAPCLSRSQARGHLGHQNRQDQTTPTTSTALRSSSLPPSRKHCFPSQRVGRTCLQPARPSPQMALSRRS